MTIEYICMMILFCLFALIVYQFLTKRIEILESINRDLRLRVEILEEKVFPQLKEQKLEHEYDRSQKFELKEIVAQTDKLLRERGWKA